jgi:hypothetical protein
MAASILLRAAEAIEQASLLQRVLVGKSARRAQFGSEIAANQILCSRRILAA